MHELAALDAEVADAAVNMTCDDLLACGAIGCCVEITVRPL